MEAVTVIAAGQNNSGKVIDCTLIGYMYKDKIIRYPKVVVGE
jgi:molecular chaperone GrpE (heat shock protein)